MIIQSFCLSIHQLQFMVALGVEREERRLPQRVELYIDFGFQRPVVRQDEEGEFLCYDGLAAHLKRYLASREFRLIETLACGALEQARLYARTALPDMAGDDLGIRLRAKKCHVPVEAIKDGASVTVSDAPAGRFAWP